MLAIVENDHHRGGREQAGDGVEDLGTGRFDHPEGGRHGAAHCVFVCTGRQRRQVREGRRLAGQHPQCQAGLAHPAGAGQGNQAVLAQSGVELGELGLSADERCGGLGRPAQTGGFVRRVFGGVTGQSAPVGEAELAQ